MHASFMETFVATGDQELVFQKQIRGPSASISRIQAVDVGVSDKLCVGSVCVDTVAFGQMLKTSVQVHSLAMQTLATEVFMVNSMLGYTVLLPNQSVVSLTYVGGDYGKLTNSDPTGASTANFATTVASAVNQYLTGSVSGYTASATATASFIKSLSKYPVPSSIIGTYGITGVAGTDVTNQVAAHLAVFSTWSSIMPSSASESASDPSASPSASSNSSTSVYAISVTEGSIVVNLLITYPSSFTAT